MKCGAGFGAGAVRTYRMPVKIAGIATVAVVLGATVSGAPAQTAAPRPISFSQTFAEPSYGTRGGYDLLAIPNTDEFSRPGEPTLPARRVLVLLPPGSDVQSVSAAPVGARSLARQLLLYPGQPAVEAEDAARSFISPDARVYGSSSLYPAQRATVDFVSNCQGYRIAAVTIHPAVYSPRTRTVLFAPRIDLSLILKSASPFPFNPESRITEWVKAKVVNPGMAAAYAPPPPKPKDAEYLIITRAMFVDALRPLAELKKKSMTTKILTLERMGAWYPGVDVQERIRNAIADHYLNHGTRFVLLAGDTPDIETMKTSIDAVSLSANGACLAALADDGRLIYGTPEELVISADGGCFKTPGNDGRLVCGSAPVQLPIWSRPGVSGPFAISADGGYVAAGQGQALRFLEKSGGATLWTLDLPANVSAVAISPCGQYLAAGDESGGVHICRLQGGYLVSHSQFAAGGAVLDLEMKAVGEKMLIAAASLNGNVHLYRADIPQKLWSAPAGGDPLISMSDKCLMVGASVQCGYPQEYADGTECGGPISFYDITVTPPALIGSFTGTAENIGQVEIGDRYAIATCFGQGGGDLVEFSVQGSTKPEVSLIGYVNWGDYFEISRIATVSRPGTTYAQFALFRGATVSYLSGPADGMIIDSLWYADTPAQVRSVALSADRSRVVAGLENGEVEVYSVSSGKLMMPRLLAPLRCLAKAQEPWAVPVRYAITDGFWWLPTDYYYSDLDGVWDADGDGVFGEMPPDSKAAERDYFPEVCVGRFSARDEATMRAIVDKTVGYASAWHGLSPAAFFSAKSPKGEGFREFVDDVIKKHMGGKEFYAYYEDDGTLAPIPNSPYDMHHFINEVNTHDPSVIYIAGHGDPSGTWFVDTSVPGKIANTGFLMFALACHTATPDEEKASLGEAMLRDANGSAVGYIGGYDTIATASASLANRFFEQFYAKNNTQQGMALATARMQWCESGLSRWSEDQSLLVNLLGDPELKLTGGAPMKDFWTDDAGSSLMGTMLDLGRPAYLEGTGSLGVTDTADVYKVLLKTGDTLSATLTTLSGTDTLVFSLHWASDSSSPLRQAFAATAVPRTVTYTNACVDSAYYLKVKGTGKKPCLYALTVKVTPPKP